MAERLEGQVAIITGAARGIGAAIGSAFCGQGAEALLVDRLETEGKATADRLVSEGCRCEFLEADVSREEQWPRIVQHCARAFGRPTVLVNNAAINRYQPLIDETLEGWSQVIAANLTSVFLGMRAVIPEMMTSGHGSIVNMSSTWGLVGVECAAAYQASKGGVTLLTKHAAVTYAKHGIRVNSIHPGLITTQMAAGMTPEEESREIGRHPLGHAGDPADIAAAAVYLASAESSFVTGAELVVDGGYTAG
jgi:NAD(P)-dependent dehydrogenase (short-subunit alcohol dehydrogenase family)